MNGYSFAGWYTAASGGTQVTDTTKYTTAGNSTLYAHWNLATYAISYTLNGGSISGQPTSYNVNTATFTLPQPTRAGYSFTGWTGSNGTTAQKSVSIAKNSTGNKSYTANWNLNTYTISYNLDGGSMSGQKTSYDVTTETFTLLAPTKTGYTFAGWTGTGLSATTKNVSVSKGSTGNRSYTATWTANKYTVSYNANGGSGTMETDTVSYGTSYTAKANGFSRTGYKFAGWTENADGTGTSWTSWIGKSWTWTYTKNITLYAQWTPITYTVKYNANGGTGTPPSDTKHTYNETGTVYPENALAKNTFTRTGYSFSGWNASRENNGVTQWYYDNWTWYEEGKNPSGTKKYTWGDGGDTHNATTVDGDVITMNAQWELSTYNVIFDANKGSGNMEKQTFTFDEEENLSVNSFTRTGYSFTGWNTQADGSGTSYTDKQKVTNLSADGSDVTLYAQWKINTYSLTVSNTVSGSMGNKVKDFTYTVKLSNDNPDGKIPAKLNAVFRDETGKEIQQEIPVSNGTVTFDLTHKQSMVLKNLPYGTVYTVTESASDGYDITKNNDTGTITKDMTAVFTNTKNGTVPTSADAPVPYPLVAIAVMGIIAMVVKRRKSK